MRDCVNDDVDKRNEKQCSNKNSNKSKPCFIRGIRILHPPTVAIRPLLHVLLQQRIRHPPVHHHHHHRRIIRSLPILPSILRAAVIIINISIIRTQRPHPSTAQQQLHHTIILHPSTPITHRIIDMTITILREFHNNSNNNNC